MNVLVNGIGNIGTTLLNLLIDYRQDLGIETIYGLKKGTVASWNEAEINVLQERGVIFCSETNSNFVPLKDVLGSVSYIFDCNANGMGMRNKSWYNGMHHLIGCSAQGSEKGFGVPFMSGINNDQIKGQRFTHIVSCNTHSLSAIVSTLTNGTEQLTTGDFVVVRRSEDIGNHQRLVSANVVSRHMKEDVGTHHAIDVKDLFDTLGKELPIQSSDITTPSQLMHTVRFSLTLNSPINHSKMNESIAGNPFIATTSKFDSNVVFELGRRYSRYGRLFSHAIVNWNNLLVDEQNNTVKGWAFIPQEGNTLISTIHAFVLQTEMKDGEAVMEKIKGDLLRKEW